MLIDVLLLVGSLMFILASCILFANAVEWLGKLLNLSHGAVGSVLAAVGTALPETIIPIIAIMFTATASSHDIGIGAIAGAPFMLSTLAFFVTGVAVFVYSSRGRRSQKITADVSTMKRDLTFFIAVYGVAIATTFVRDFILIRYAVSIGLLIAYVFYVKLTLADDAEGEHNLDPLYLTRLFKLKPTMLPVAIQIIISLAGIIIGAQAFVKYTSNVSMTLGMSALILSIIITPIATELPEKLNSIIWIRQKKDTLALGNITGAMVFQSCIPVAFGISFTPWALDGITMLSALLAFSSAIVNLLWLRAKNYVSPYFLCFGGVLYAIFIWYIFFSGMA